MLPESLEFAQVYFVRGGASSGAGVRYEVPDPPTSGYSHVVILRNEKRSTIFCPYTLQAYQVSNRSAELTGAREKDVSPARLAEVITKAWADWVKLGFQRDYGVAAMVLTKLGAPVPKFLELPQDSSAVSPRKNDESKQRGGKPIVEENLKPCRRESKRGEVAAFFMQSTPQSLHEAMARLGLTRSGVLSHLFTLNKDHGIGYTLVNDCATLLIPDGFDLFAYVEPVKPVKESKPVKVDEHGQVVEPKKRTSGKPVVPEALKPIPEPGKRATVARFFEKGFFPIATVMAKLDLDRSAVLSHLFTINKENGLGYELSEDSASARLIIPEGHAAFAPKQPRAKKGGE